RADVYTSLRTRVNTRRWSKKIWHASTSKSKRYRLAGESMLCRRCDRRATPQSSPWWKKYWSSNGSSSLKRRAKSDEYTQQNDIRKESRFVIKKRSSRDINPTREMQSHDGRK